MARTEDRIETLQELYVDDKITEEQFEELADAAFSDEPPFHRDWFLKQLGVTTTESRHDSWWLYRGETYTVDGEYIVPVEED